MLLGFIVVCDVDSGIYIVYFDIGVFIVIVLLDLLDDYVFEFDWYVM